MTTDSYSRRAFVRQSAACLAASAVLGIRRGSTVRAADERAADENAPDEPRGPTDFQIACMTLPYARFPLTRALEGIRRAGYQYVAWGTTHVDEQGKPAPLMPPDAPPEKARELAGRCRDLGLEPLMMFSMVYPEQPEAVEVLTRRIRQAAAGGVPQVLTFGHTEGGKRERWLACFQQLAPIARDNNVQIVVKQHGGSTGTGAACAEITREIGSEWIKVNYDAGNVMDYLNLDPLADVRTCADEIRSFCIKDHRNFPRDEDCGPGFGEIDHFRLLATVARMGRKLPLCCENIAPPLLPPADQPDVVDRNAQRSREFLETVVAGLKRVELNN